MSYKRRQPVSEKEMDKSRYDGHHTICQTLRDIYHASDDENIRIRCRMAMAMAKAMHRKLKDYKKKFEQTEVT